MEPSDIAKSYDRLALGWQQNTPATYGMRQLLRALQFVTSKGAALDVGCGSQGRFIEKLIQDGFVPEGIDISREMIALASQRHPAVTFHNADICEWQLPKSYSFISAWDSTFHLPIHQQEPVLKKLCAGLLPGGILLFTCGGVDADEITGIFNGEELGYSTLGIEKFAQLLIQFGCRLRHIEFDQYPEKHVYLIAQKA
jgi:SAM-dependent methyltransferase